MRRIRIRLGIWLLIPGLNKIPLKANQQKLKSKKSRSLKNSTQSSKKKRRLSCHKELPSTSFLLTQLSEET